MARDIAAGILVFSSFWSSFILLKSSFFFYKKHLHKEKVIHRDIAARNVLVGDNDGMINTVVFNFLIFYKNKKKLSSFLTLVWPD